MQGKPNEVHALRYHDINKNTYVRYYQGHTAQVTSVCMSPKSDTFVSAAQVRVKHVHLVWPTRENYESYGAWSAGQPSGCILATPP